MKLFVIVGLMISSASWAAPTSNLSLREQAAAETRIDGTAQKSATGAQVQDPAATGMLSLKDPRPEIITRTWIYFAGFTAQNFQARGSVSTDSVGHFDLDKNGSTLMPGLVVGIMSPELQTKGLLWRVGLRGDASFASQSTSVTFPSGYSVDDARLNSTLLSVGPAISLTWQRVKWMALTFTPQFGTVNYTQTSSNEFAHFSKESAYLGLNYGLDFQLNQTWSLFTEYSQRTLRDSHQEIALQKDNFALGTKVTW